MRGLDFGQVGEEIEIVDDAELDDLLDSAVIGDQVAAESREMDVVLQVDMHLLPRVGREQNGQQERCITLFEKMLRFLHGCEDTKKRDRGKRSLQKIPTNEDVCPVRQPPGEADAPGKSRAA